MFVFIQMGPRGMCARMSFENVPVWHVPARIINCYIFVVFEQVYTLSIYRAHCHIIYTMSKKTDTLFVFAIT